MATRFDPVLLKRCYEEVAALHRDAIALENTFEDKLRNIPQEYVDSAKNLLHYMALRKHDIRSLQIELGYLGLSSLGRLEAHVLAGLESVLAAIRKMSDEPLDFGTGDATAINFREGDRLLAQHTSQLLGPRPANHMPRIMVTLPSQAAADCDLVEQLVMAGMNIARINSAHDGLPQWIKMVENVRAASRTLDRPCRILFDLCGPKLRTGTPTSHSVYLKRKTVKDHAGNVVDPALVRFISASTVVADLPNQKWDIAISDAMFAALVEKDKLECTDARGKKRTIEIILVNKDYAEGKCLKSIVLHAGVKMNHVRDNELLGTGHITGFPGILPSLSLRESDLLVLTGPEPNRQGMYQASAGTGDIPSIPCTLPEVFPDIKKGDRIYFDDGKIAGLVEQEGRDSVSVRIKRTQPGGSKLRGDKGINLPDSQIHVPALSEQDIEHLQFTVDHADMVGLSFVRDPSDIESLHRAFSQYPGKNPGIVLKIETAAGFEHLFSLLLTGLQFPPLGVMVARGDLGVELGFERMAEVQEQILWLCEAAHVPVIWATQVLEQMTKTGMPTRGEVTDAAMSARAECVMLNKGPFVVETVKLLDDILSRMQDHNHKKTPMLRKLKISEGRWMNPEG